MILSTNQFRRFAASNNGTVAVLFAFVLIPVLGMVALASDFGQWSGRKSHLVGAGDAASLAGARTLVNALLSGQASRAVELSTAAATRTLSANRAEEATSNVVVSTSEPISVRVDLDESAKKQFSNVLEIPSITIRTTSEVIAVHAADACVVALDAAAAPGIEFNLSGEVSASDCSIWSNSTMNTALVGKGSGSVTADAICAVGRSVTDGGLNMQPSPRSSCFPVKDPFARWSPPSYSSVCAASNLVLDKPGNYELSPGTYCGGITIKGGANVSFKPGLFVIKDGPLLVEGGGSISGHDVSFLLAGNKALVNLGGASKVELSAPTTGDMAGMLFASSRTAAPQVSIFRGGNVFHLEGSVYLPTHQVEYAGGPEGVFPAAHTQLIAGKVKFNGSSRVTFRTKGGSSGPPKAFTHIYLAR
jgi:Flp pilus assembly protein TadG